MFPVLRGFSLGFSRRLRTFFRRRRARSFSFLSPRGPEHLRELTPGGVELGARGGGVLLGAQLVVLRGPRAFSAAVPSRRAPSPRRAPGSAPASRAVASARAASDAFSLDGRGACSLRAPSRARPSRSQRTARASADSAARGAEADAAARVSASVSSAVAARRPPPCGGGALGVGADARRTPRTPRAGPRAHPPRARAGTSAPARREAARSAAGSCVASRLRRRAAGQRLRFLFLRRDSSRGALRASPCVRSASGAVRLAPVAGGGRPGWAGQGLEHRAVQRGRLRARDRGGRDVARALRFSSEANERDVRERRRVAAVTRTRSSLHGGRGRIGHASGGASGARASAFDAASRALRLGRLGRVGCVRNRDVSRGRLRSLSLGPLPLESLELQLPGELLLLLGLLRRHRLDDSRRLPPARRRMMGATTRNEPGNFAARKRHKRDDEARGPSPRLAGGRQRLAGCRR